MPQSEKTEIVSCEAISEAFLALHKQDDFETLPPSSLLHPSVPMSFVMSAGLIQVENDLEQIVEKTGGKFAFTQPCFRHFDVKQVGLDTTHLSLFHMSAAFHIGCSERETVLPRLWHFLTEVLKLNKDNLWVTYLDDSEFERDDRTLNCWRNVGVDDARLIGLDQEHCFWRQRSTGQIASDGKKCGPHTEVFVERDEFVCGEHCVAGNPGACRCGRFVEVSNSLFIENYISDEGGLIPADTVFAECVIGIERLAMVLQGVRDVHHVDRFDEWQEKLKALPLAKSNLQCTFPDVFLNADQSINTIIGHLAAFCKLSEHGSPEPGRGGRKRIMRHLARSAFTEIIVLGWNAEKIIINLIPEQSLAQAFLESELKRFEKTITRGKAKLNLSNITFDRASLKQFEQNHGLPLSLSYQYIHKNLSSLPTAFSNKHKTFRVTR